jgi:exodeoxyribonuclease VII small subunit
MAESQSRRSKAGSSKRQREASDPAWLADVAGLSFQEARTALELAMAQLQADSLEVEEMAGLYQRAEAYANRCEAVLRRVEQEVIEWDTDHPSSAS